MRRYISELSDQFIKEASNSPNLLYDMAQMEKYMAESYSNRAFIEMMQNADDAHASKFIAFYKNGNLYIGNDGFPFSKEDVELICRSGASKKNRENSIGYRGVGFKSTTCFSNSIYIFSDDCIFAFSKELTARKLRVRVDSVPTVRVPFWIEKQELELQMREDIRELNHRGYNTVFAFVNSDLDKVASEKSNVTADCLLFLRNIDSVLIEGIGHITRYDRILQTFSSYSTATIKDNLSNKDCRWYLLGDRDNYYIAIKSNDDTSINALDDKEDKNVFHCFLPTLDETGFSFRINGDFSTDPSRKHILQDERTIRAIEFAGRFLSLSTVDSIRQGEEWRDLLLMAIARYETKNKYAARLFQVFQESIRQNRFLRSVTGKWISPSDAVVLPSWVNDNIVSAMRRSGVLSESCIRTESKEYDEFYKAINIMKLDSSILFSLLKNSDAVTILNDENSLLVLLHTVSSCMEKPMACFELDRVYIKYGNESILLSSAIRNDDFQKSISNCAKEIGEMKSLDCLFKEMRVEASTSSPIDRILKKRSIAPKWKTAEQLCVDLEKEIGNRATDVSSKNLGYDVISERPDGTKRYIEVKSVRTLGDPIVLTNNEYTTAHQYGEEYFFLIVSQDDNHGYLYIQNPLQYSDNFEKRVRMWEWVFSNYNNLTN